MKYVINFLVLMVVAVLFVFILTPKNIMEPKGKPVLASSIRPLSMIVSEIAGESFDVRTILPTGASPHTFEPSPKSIADMRGAVVLFSVGHGLDDWSIGLSKSADIKEHVIVDANITLIGDNPHYFLSPVNADIIAQTVRDELTRLYPEKKDVFSRNEIAFAGSLHAVQTQAKNDLEAIGSPQIATFHGAWDYFARDLGLTIAAVFEEYPGKEPTPAYLREFENQVRDSGAKVIFAEPQFGTALMEPIAADLGVAIRVLDPEGSANGAKTYEELIRKNVDEIVQANTK